MQLKGEIQSWIDSLIERELSRNTILQYTQAVRKFEQYVKEHNICGVCKKDVIDYKNSLMEQVEANTGKRAARGKVGKISTLNLYLTALNKFFRDNGHDELTVKTLDDISGNVIDNVITENEYQRLIEWAYRLNDLRTGLIMETLAGTGIRISELKFLTVESLKTREMVVTNKGKTRRVFIPKELTKKLRKYCRQYNLDTGIIFHGYKWIETDSGKERVADTTKMLSNTSISRSMKRIAGKARGIKLEKIHPHTFRHLFAKRYANMPGSNPYVLPMILGHSTHDVTGLYVKPSSQELKQIMDDVEACYKNVTRQTKKRKSLEINRPHYHAVF